MSGLLNPSNATLYSDLTQKSGKRSGEYLPFFGNGDGLGNVLNWGQFQNLGYDTSSFYGSNGDNESPQMGITDPAAAERWLKANGLKVASEPLDGNRNASYLVNEQGQVVGEPFIGENKDAAFQLATLAAGALAGGAIAFNPAFGGLGAAGGTVGAAGAGGGTAGAAGGLGEATTGLMGQYGGYGALGDASLLTGGSLGTVAQPAGGLSFGSMAGGTGLMQVPGADWTNIPTSLGNTPATLNASGTLSPGLQALGAGGGLGSIGTTAATGLLSGIDPTLLQLGGAALGALSSKDQEVTKTQTNEPWAPAQPWIKSNIEQGQALQKKYTEQPFSQGQQAAYGNLYGLLNSYNKEVLPGLLSNANAMSQGYDRYAPKETRARPQFGAIGSTWNPGLLKFGG